ncbi:MAG: hypothetical protein OER98_12490 [Gammaproteobacteria bacterium]|nr:hypothetical protein [Gammaproteobacteria bacterium]
MRKNLRYLILLLILLFVVVNETLNKTRSTSWENPLWVRIYAVNGDGREATEKYIDSLKTDSFKTIEKFVNLEARRYGIKIDAIDVEYNGHLQSGPPQPPNGQSLLGNIWWSLKFRAWATHRAWNSDSDAGDIELFVSYYDITTTQSLRHSVGLQGGLIGIINAFADKSYRGSNEVVIAHEFMHTLGASDKYAPDNQPILPQGYAEPGRIPLFPQQKAELMGGRIPLSMQDSRMPDSLNQVVVGTYTAAEINWTAE